MNYQIIKSIEPSTALFLRKIEIPYRSINRGTRVYLKNISESEKATTSPLDFTKSLFPMSEQIPAAIAASVAVRTFPPKVSANSVNRHPTDKGPTEIGSLEGSTIDPPPSPIEWRSGILKLVKTPPICEKYQKNGKLTKQIYFDNFLSTLSISYEQILSSQGKLIWSKKMYLTIAINCNYYS